MSISPQVRQIGEVSDVHGVRVHVGVDHDAVTIGRYVLAATDDFSRLYFAAVEAAKANADTPCTGACCLTADRDNEKD